MNVQLKARFLFASTVQNKEIIVPVIASSLVLQLSVYFVDTRLFALSSRSSNCLDNDSVLGRNSRNAQLVFHNKFHTIYSGTNLIGNDGVCKLAKTFRLESCLYKICILYVFRPPIFRQNIFGLSWKYFARSIFNIACVCRRHLVGFPSSELLMADMRLPGFKYHAEKKEQFICFAEILSAFEKKGAEKREITVA